MEWNERRMTNVSSFQTSFHHLFLNKPTNTHTHTHTHTFIPAVKICLFTIRPGRDLNRPSWPGPSWPGLTWLRAELTRIRKIHNNLSSRALVWHTYHHDVFADIVDISFLNILKDRYIAVRKEEKIQVSLSSWLFIKGSEKGNRFAVCSLCNSSFSITHQTLQACEMRIRAWDAKQSRRLLLSFKATSPDRVRHAGVLSLHSQISKSIIFKQKPFIYKVFLWCDGSLKFVLSEKNIGKNSLSPIGSYQVTMQWRFWVSSLVAIF